MPSPADNLVAHIADSVTNIAPERAADIQRLFEGVTLRQTSDPGLAFGASAASREVTFSTPGLELLWVESYVLWTVQRLYREAGQQAGRYKGRNKTGDDPEQHERLSLGVRVYLCCRSGLRKGGARCPRRMMSV